MKLVIAVALVFYWAIMAGVFIFGHDVLNDYSYVSDQPLNDTLSEADINAAQTSPWSLIGRFSLWMLFGIGLGPDTPAWFVTIFAIWQVIIVIFTIIFIISLVGLIFGGG